MDTPENIDPSTSSLKRENIHTVMGEPDKNKHLVATSNSRFYLDFSNKGQRYPNGPSDLGIKLMSRFSRSPKMYTTDKQVPDLHTAPEVFWSLFSHSLGTENLPVTPSKR